MKIRLFYLILLSLIPTMVSAVSPLPSWYITNERAAERYKDNYEYFVSVSSLLYYWQSPSFLDFNMQWGFCLTGDQCSGTYQLRGKIRDGVDLSSGSTERIVDKRVARSLSSDTAMLLLRVWSKAFKIMKPDDRMGGDGTSYFTGVNLFYGPPDREFIQADGTFWSPDEFSMDYDLAAVASSIYEYLFSDAKGEDSIIEKCQVILQTSQKERKSLQRRFERISKLISLPVDPFNPPKPLKQEVKDLYVSEYKAMWLRHYRKEESDFDRISHIILPAAVTATTKTLVPVYERKLEHSEKVLAIGESIIIPSFQEKGTKLTRVLVSLSEASSLHSENGKGLSIIAFLNPNETDPSISIEAEEKNFFELLDSICIQAGPAYYWSASDSVVVQRKTNQKTKLVDPFGNPKLHDPAEGQDGRRQGGRAGLPSP